MDVVVVVVVVALVVTVIVDHCPLSLSPRKGSRCFHLLAVVGVEIDCKVCRCETMRIPDCCPLVP